MTMKEYQGQKYIYTIYSGPLDRCPVCGKVTQLCGMTEEREYYNPVKKCRSWTGNKCRSFDFACRDCLIKQQY